MEKLKQRWNNLELTGCALKWTGILSMTADHIGVMFFPDIWQLRAAGRLAFPIFAFITAVGFMYTGNVIKYGLKLLALAVISEPFFDYALFGSFFFPGRQNVFFTLALGVWMLYTWIRVDNLVMRWISVILLMLIAELFHTDYNSMGLLMILIFYCFYNENRKRNILTGIVNIFLMGRIQMFGVLALIPISFYKGTQGRRMKAFFYAFYPLHLFLLLVIRQFTAG